MGTVSIPNTWRGLATDTLHASAIAVVTSHAVRAPAPSTDQQAPSTSTPTTWGGVETAVHGAKLSASNQSKGPRARQGGGRGVAGSGARRGVHGAAIAPARSTAGLAAWERASSPPGELPGAAGSRRAGREGGRDAHRLGVGAALGLRARDSRSAELFLAAHRPPPAVLRPRPAVFIQTRVAGEAEAAKTAAEHARIPGNVSAAPRPTHGSDRRLACARRARARGGRALPGKGGTGGREGEGRVPAGGGGTH